MKRLHAWAIFSLLATSCSGQVWHEPAANPQTAIPEKGIVYYDRFEALQYLDYTALMDEKGNATGKVCKPVRAYSQVAMMVDYGHPKIIYYSPGLLETYKFTPQINADGTLGSGAVESTPDKGETFKNVAAGIGSIAGAVAGFKDFHGSGICTKADGTPCAVTAPPPPVAIRPACDGKPSLVFFEKIDMTKIPEVSLSQDPNSP